MNTKKHNLGPSKPRQRRSISEAFIDTEAAAKPEASTMFNVRMTTSVHRRLKFQAFKEDRTMKEIVEESVLKYLNEHES
ncbi:hypothetical protein COCCU_14600 (plasmid) [Corynebacterium occultum]|uniref:ParG n=1 Tax=Corynebacterium occultum TaxID=2675219 RepID=A0A6B8WFS5_9CORY|nr:hypothetical protein [Corynebacterium occultum]QGU08810.1 hypothetical protein COCCU_14600 [Corynebacterium occultum]